MVTAIRKVHGPNGPWIQQSGYEYKLVLIAVMAALVESGPGSPSVDRALAIEAGRRIAADDAAEQPNQGATGRFVRNGETVEPEPVTRGA